MLKELLSSRLIQGGIVFVVVMVVGSLSYFWHVEREIARDLAETAAEARRYEESLGRAPQDSAARKPNADAVGVGRAPKSDGNLWHADEEEAVEIEEPEAPPTLTRSELGGRAEALPYPMTPSNRHVWDALVTEAAEDPELMQKLLPDTKEKAYETMTALMNSWAPLEIQSPFKKAMWRKMAALYPNDAEVLVMATIYMPYGPRASRAEKEAYVAHWERLKRLNDEQGIPITSPFRKTHSLSQTYIDLGEYDKALQNIKEQQERIAALNRAGLHHQFMYHGLLGGSDLANATELIRRHKEKQDKIGVR